MTETPVLIPVTIIEHRGDSVLVEWLEGDRLKRAVIPAAKAADGVTDPETLDFGIPHGLPWEEMIELHATPALIAEELRKRGIWTIDDMHRDQSAIFGALQAVYGLDLAALINAAETYVRGR